MKPTWFRTSLVLGAFFWVAVSSAFGATASDTKVVNFASFSIASLSRLADEAKDLGIELPPMLTAAGLERQFPMIPADGLDADRPFGIFSFAGPKSATPAGQTYVVAFPGRRVLFGGRQTVIARQARRTDVRLQIRLARSAILRNRVVPICSRRRDRQDS